MTSVRAERRVLHCSLILYRVKLRLAGDGIPHLCLTATVATEPGVGPAGCNDEPAVPAELRAIQVLLPGWKRDKQPAGLGIPHTRGLLYLPFGICSCNNFVAIGTEV